MGDFPSKPDAEDERELLDAIKAGDDDAAAAFDRRFRGQLLRAAQQRRIPHQDAEDVVQETLVSAIAQLAGDRFERRSTLRSWVWSIFSRRAADWIRTTIRRERSVVALDVLEASAPIARRGAQAQALAVDDEDLRLRVREALASLPARERLVLLLNVQRRMRAWEIAGLLRLGTKNTEAILTAAKKRFRARLAESEENPPPGRLKE